jgi:hypothetical protein
MSNADLIARLEAELAEARARQAADEQTALSEELQPEPAPEPEPISGRPEIAEPEPQPVITELPAFMRQHQPPAAGPALVQSASNESPVDVYVPGGGS